MFIYYSFWDLYYNKIAKRSNNDVYNVIYSFLNYFEISLTDSIIIEDLTNSKSKTAECNYCLREFYTDLEKTDLLCRYHVITLRKILPISFSF